MLFGAIIGDVTKEDRLVIKQIRKGNPKWVREILDSLLQFQDYLEQ